MTMAGEQLIRLREVMARLRVECPWAGNRPTSRC